MVLKPKGELSEAFKRDTYFHLHNSGVEGRIIFNSKEDFDRFEAYLYLLNAAEGQRAANFFTGNRAASIFESARGETLVSIAAYSFSPREYHMLVCANSEGGISKFMQKLQTAYTMYFNRKYQRSGALFQSSYKSLAAQSPEHLKYMFAYAHLQPAQMFNEHFFEEHLGQIGSEELPPLIAKAMHYRYSSVHEYSESKFVITAPNKFPKYFLRMKDGASLLSAIRGFSKKKGRKLDRQ